jgi:hypothetical protein
VVRPLDDARPPDVAGAAVRPLDDARPHDVAGAAVRPLDEALPAGAAVRPLVDALPTENVPVLAVGSQVANTPALARPLADTLPTENGPVLPDEPQDAPAQASQSGEPSVALPDFINSLRLPLQEPLVDSTPIRRISRRASPPLVPQRSVRLAALTHRRDPRPEV